jgi:hypothetical protein
MSLVECGEAHLMILDENVIICKVANMWNTVMLYLRGEGRSRQHFVKNAYDKEVVTV